MPKKVYPGVLNEPICLDRLFAAPSPEERERNLAKIEGRIDAKFELLFEHYEIALDDRDRWETLAGELAREHVRGLQFVADQPRKQGAPKKWRLSMCKDFVDAVDSGRVFLAKQRGCSVDEVTLRDAIDDFFKIRLRRMSPRTVAQIWCEKESAEARYREARERVEASKKWLDRHPLPEGQPAPLNRLGAPRLRTIRSDLP
jgi:hypothetical protein